VRRLLVTDSVVLSSPILATLMEEVSSSETSVLTRATRRNIPKTPFFIVTAVKTSNLTLKYTVGIVGKIVYFNILCLNVIHK
jgi:hypothetical protein